ncbi:HPP family protein [Croceicoccus bisphenolivorans]|uniref:HPP family protein n=1 Tax=Croceicoccus bisphenolivorans TaxID=1783232 RepID=UPI001FE0C445|nr:HPP family protein [Croceicoccus bisphenolivorans]
MRGAIGATVGIAIAGWVGLLVAGPSAGGYPFLIAPLGASAVLVFAIPASPLAQPWPVIGGDLLSAMAGLASGLLLGDPVLSCAVGVGAAIGIMTIARCLHPPGGACALLCALGATGADGWGFAYIVPIAANVLTLVLIGWLYNNCTGHRWPHVQYPVPRRTVPFPHPGTFRRSDIEEVLSDWDEVLDIDVDDLDAVFRAVERKAAKRNSTEGSAP